MKYALCTLVSALTLCASPPPARAENTAPFPLMENYTGAKQLGDFMNDAWKFIQDNPGSPHTPRLLFDIYMLATLGGKTGLADNCKSLLILKCANTPYGVYVLRSFPDGEAYGKFLANVLDGEFHNMSDETARNFVETIRLATARFGDKFLEGGFALKCLLVARQAGDAGIALDIAKKLGKDKATAQETTLELCLRTDLTITDRILKLNETIGDKDVPSIIGYYLHRLSEAQRSDPRIVRIGIHVDIYAKRFAQALKTINTLTGGELDPQILYWKAMCLLAEDKRPEAIKALTLAQKTWPKSPWRDTSAKLATCIKGYGKNMLASADTILTLSRKFRAEAEVIELEVGAEAGKSKTPYRLYLGMVMADEIIEIVLLRKDSVMLAYRSAPDGLRIYSPSSKEIVHFPGTQLAPVFTFSITRKPNGAFNTSFLFHVGKSLQQGVKANEKAWNSPYLTTKAGLLDYLCSEAVRGGRMPVSITTKGKTTVLKWTTFGIDKPETNDIEFHVGDANVLTGIRTDSFQTRNIRYGRKSAMKLSAPKWPDVKVRVAGSSEIPFATLGKLIGEFMNVVTEFNKDE
ncbi:MAG: hypothetical protein QGH60_17140 [Phycisphaerae bacterium]|nr:hypothetical protein [Phycisphaerae bacterium]